MRIFLLALTIAVTIALCFILSSRSLLPAPLGNLLSPQHGVWQNAENISEGYSADIAFPQLKGKVDVYFDERLVPHVFAEQENDAYFVQGYLHAKFRLWQMELQSMAAAGRASEIIGDVALDHDREFRRMGMVYAAENSLREMESDPAVKEACDAYTAGVNAYIEALSESEMPLEYKLIGYYPEKWSNLKSALFLKYMSHNLASQEKDFEMTQAKGFFSPSDFAKLFPAYQDSLDPIIPEGTVFSPASIKLKAPVDYDTLSVIPSLVEPYSKADKDNGSNNWAVSGSKTSTGFPILCNDPHLGLNLPSLWYEIQISTPSYNAYGASFPGAPAVIIGYNDSCAWGFTNGGRDVRDYYEIKFRDESRQEYWFDSAWKKTTFRYEKIRIKGKPDYIDTVAYTLFGPVMYDKSFGGKRNTSEKNYAVRWKAHDPSKEILVFLLINRAKNYADYAEAVSHLHTPGQNFVFATRSGDIAIKTQGEWPAKWKGQGDYIMPGTDSSYLWQAMIPQEEVPFQYNPERGFVSSANQRPLDSTYPYYLGREYPVSRGAIINRMLTRMQGISPQDMMAMQTDNYNIFAEWAVPLLLKNMKANELNSSEKKYFDHLSGWNLRNDVNSKGATVFEIAWKSLLDLLYKDEYAKAPENIAHPVNSTMLEALLSDSTYSFIDNIETPVKETLPDVVTASFKMASAELGKAEADNKLEWAKYKDTHIEHLAKKLKPFSRFHLPIGGSSNVINATKADHGPSWRMIISLTEKIEAFGVYPGGQSGNPGSPYYDGFIDHWVAGKYYSLWMMKKEEESDKRVKWKMKFGP